MMSEKVCGSYIDFSGFISKKKKFDKSLLRNAFASIKTTTLSETNLSIKIDHQDANIGANQTRSLIKSKVKNHYESIKKKLTDA